MINIYGKGATVDSSEYWDDRTTYNGLTQFLKYDDNTIAIKNIFNDNTELLSLVESLNSTTFQAGGVVQGSFNNEFNITEEDFVHIDIDGVNKYYIRCSPGIATFNGNANITKPATELASAEIKSILNLEDDDEFVDIKYNYSTDKFKGEIHKIINNRIKVFEFANGEKYDNEIGGYDTGIELLYSIYSTIELTSLFKEAIGDELNKIDLELTKEVIDIGTYHWVLNSSGLIDLVTDTTGTLDIGNFTVDVLLDGISTIDNTHIYSFETSIIDGNIVVSGNLTVNGTEIIANTETVLIEDNLLVINNLGDNTGNISGVSLGIAGIEVDRGLLTNYRFLFRESDDTFVIGMSGSEQAVATRQDDSAIVDTGVAFYDLASYSFLTDSGLTYNSSTSALTTTTFIGALTGHASSDLALTGGTLTGDLFISVDMASAPTGNIRLKKTGTTANGGGSYIQFDSSPSATARGNYNARIEGIRTATGGSASAELNFYTTAVDENLAALQRMTISSRGNVGIGTTSPSSLLHLDFTGEENYSHDTTSGSLLIESNPNTGEGNYTQGIIFSSSNGVVAGRLGAAIYSYQSTADVDSSGLGFAVHTNTYGDPRVTAMVISSSSNVGIGTDDPDEKLDIAGDIQFGAGGDAKMSFNSVTNSIDFIIN